MNVIKTGCLACDKMAKFVIAGKADCAEYSRAEMLGDFLQCNLPDFKVHKLPKDASEWSVWLKEICGARGWQFDGPCIVWRELIDRGGKGLLLGGSREFEEYAHHYYNVSPLTSTEEEREIALENTASLQLHAQRSSSPEGASPTVVCITSASSVLAYHVTSLLCTSHVYSRRGGMELRLLCEDPVEEEIARGGAMEVQDLALSHVLSVHVCSDVQEAFEGAHVIFVLDHVRCPAESCSEEMEERSEGKGQENLEGKGQEGRTDEKMKLLQKSGEVFKVYKDVLSSLKDKPRKVIVTGPFAALGVSLISPAVDMCVAPAVLTCQQAASIIAERLSINPSHVRGVAVWGGTRGRETVLDLSSVVVHSYKRSAITGPEWFSRPLRECVFEGEWLNAELPQLVEQRSVGEGDTCVPPPLAEGVALVTFVECWEAGSSDHTFSVALCLNDVGDFPSIVAISLPCCLKDGKLELNLKRYQALDETVKERLEHSIERIKREVDSFISNSST